MSTSSGKCSSHAVVAHEQRTYARRRLEDGVDLQLWMASSSEWTRKRRVQIENDLPVLDEKV